jgi:hypothetical protein
MTPEQLVEELQAMEPEHLKRTAELAARMFSEKAEAIYIRDPENNGMKAQPYADIAQLLTEASMVFDPETNEISEPVDEEAVIADTQRPSTVSEALEASRKDPWGGR